MAIIFCIEDNKDKLKRAGPYLHGHYTPVVDTSSMRLSQQRDQEKPQKHVEE